MFFRFLFPVLIVSTLILSACGNSVRTSKDEAVVAPSETIAAFDDEAEQEHRKLVVTASAYNSLRGQTDNTPDIAAWGDKLKPGMKAIAVSRDLLSMGLTHNTHVRIKGLPGTYRVLDKMNKRWSRKIDIYMGTDRNKAMNWGRRTVEISWVDADN
jgi:3D (Asp-Asp-Asp) domain-containing protein